MPSYIHYAHICTYMTLPFTSGRPDFGSEGVRCFTREDVRGRVTGFVGAASVLDEVLAWTIKYTRMAEINLHKWMKTVKPQEMEFNKLELNEESFKSNQVSNQQLSQML